MSLVLDTSAVIELVERRDPRIVEELRTAREAPTISVVTLAELAVGWASWSADSPQSRTYHAARRLRVVNIVVDGLQTEPTGLIVSFGVCRVAGIKGNDAWIGATAHLASATLLTFDTTLAARYARVGHCTLLTR